MNFDLSRVSLAELQRKTQMEFDVEVDPASLDIQWKDIQFHDKLTIRGTIMDVDDQILVRANMKIDWDVDCGRCLQSYEDGCEQDVAFTIEEAEDKYLNLTDYFREELLLNFPMIFLCSDTCKGLCATCGTNLNENQCRCVHDGETLINP